MTNTNQTGKSPYVYITMPNICMSMLLLIMKEKLKLVNRPKVTITYVSIFID